MSATAGLDRVIEQPSAAPTAASTPDSRPAEKDNTTFRGIVQGDAELNFEWSAFLIDSLVAAGVTHVVMCPGAQMAPLALACRANPALKITVVIDERAAGFFALGLSRVTRRPTILICTSGSAVGEFFPAVMEASTGMIPLILITADRAPENQDRCSAQAIDQIRAYGAHARSSHSLPLPDASIGTLSALASRIYEQSLWPMPGPVHVNQPFRDPLVPKNRVKRAVPQPPTITEPVIQLRQEDVERMADTLSGRRGVIVCGATENVEEPGFPAAVYELARQLAAPIIADPFSNLRFGAPADSGVIARADTFLRAARFTATHQPEWILNFGGPAMSKPVLTYMQESTASDYIVVDPTTRWSDPLLRATHIVRSSPETLCRALTESGRLKPAPDVWRQSFIACDGFIDTLSRSAFDTSLWEAPIVRRLIKAAPDGAVVFSGNSMSVRDFDSFSGSTDTRLRLLANRGTNGIDGSIGTLIGIAAAQRHTKTVCMIGDMAFSHDVGSLQLAGDLDIVLVVLNNGGGGIFEYLPTANVPEYQDFLSPPTLSIGAAGKACGWKHWEIHDLDGLNAALNAAMAAKGPCLIEAVIDRKASVRQHKLFWSAVNGINATIRLRGPEGMIATFGQVQPASQDSADDSLNFDRDD